jgi:flagellar protein FlaJ
MVDSKTAKGAKEIEDTGRIIECPRCNCEIIDMSKGPDVGRCIRCKHVFEIESEDSKKRKGKESPHRIRRTFGLGMMFKKPVEMEEEVGEGDEEDTGGQFKAKRSKEETTKLMVIVISLGLMILFFILAALQVRIVLSEQTSEVELEKSEVTHIDHFYVQLDWLAWIMIGLMSGFGPIGIYEGRRNNRIVKLEERLADFLRDLAEASRSGQTLHDAVITASGGEYGELLPDITKMAQQISWGVSATEALNRFSERVKTPLVKRAVTLINEASAAGGDVSRVLEAAANDTKEIQMLQRERKIQMSLYVAVIFVSFVVFLVVILIVYATFVPQMRKMGLDQKYSAEEGGAEEETTELGSASTFNSADVDFGEIKIIFIAAALVHAIGDGLVAGLMGTGRMTDGLKLSFAMVMIVFMIFIFLMPAAAIG